MHDRLTCFYFYIVIIYSNRKQEHAKRFWEISKDVSTVLDGSIDDFDDAVVEKGQMKEFGSDDSQSDDDDSEYNEDEESSDSDDDTNDGEVFENIDEEISMLLEERQIEGTINDYVDDGAGLFDVAELEDLKTKEQVLKGKTRGGYYISKIRHRNSYETIPIVFTEYITRENLMMLHHPFSTQQNEALNRSVSSCAPKDRTFSTTPFFKTRVNVAEAIQVKGNEVFWTRALGKCGILIDANLTHHLRLIDTRRIKHKGTASINTGKTKRIQRRYEKLNTAVNEHISSQKEGLGYESGADVITLIGVQLSGTLVLFRRSVECTR